MQEFNPYAAPLTDLTTPRDPNEVGVWRDGAYLVMSKDAELPDRCLKCNEPAEGWRLRRKLSWHPQYYYLIILFNLIVYAVVALIVRQTAKVQVPLCQKHRNRRFWLITCAWVLGLLGPALIVAGAASESMVRASLPSEQAEYVEVSIMILGVFSFLAGLILAVIASQVVFTHRIDKRYVWLRKVSPDLLAELPLWSTVLPVTGSNLDNRGMISFPKKAKTGTVRNDLYPDDEL